MILKTIRDVIFWYFLLDERNLNFQLRFSDLYSAKVPDLYKIRQNGCYVDYKFEAYKGNNSITPMLMTITNSIPYNIIVHIEMYFN